MKRRNREINIFSMSALDLFASALGAFILIAIIIFPYFPNIGMAELEALEAALDRLRDEEQANDALAEIREELEDRLRAVQAEYEAQVTGLQQRVDALTRQVADTNELRDRLSNAEQAQAQAEQGQAQAEQAQAQAEQGQAQAEQAQAQAEQGQAQAEQAQAQAEEERDVAEGQLAEALADNEELEANLADERRREFLSVNISWSTDDDVDLHVIDPRGNEYAWNSRSHPGSPARFEEDTVDGPGNELWLHPTVEPGQYEIYYNLYSGQDIPVVRGAVIYSRGREELRNVTLTFGPMRHVATVLVETDASGGVTVSVR